MSNTPVKFDASAAEADRVRPFAQTVWHEFSPLALKYNACNLGQGFPNWNPPAFITKAAHDAHDEITTVPGGKLNQYARSAGHMRLVNAIAKMYSPLLGQELNGATDVCVSAGASEAIFLVVSAFVNPGDEVILLEPFFDIYLGAITLCGGVPRYVSLKPPKDVTGEHNSSDWTLDENELRQAMSDKTKLIILNTPHNPLGKVYSRSEIEMISRVVKEHPRCIMLSDEVYEWLTFDGTKHERIATVPGMWERTVTVSSASKTFSITGWKIGWTVGPANLISAIMKVQAFVCFSIATPLQEAVAVALEQSMTSNYFNEFRAEYQRRRDFLLQTLRDSGLEPIVPQGSFFILVDIGKVKLPEGAGTEKTITGQNLHLKDWNFCRWLTTEMGVAAIPVSAFYSEEHMPNNVIRLAFCKTDDILSRARDNLLKLKDLIQK
jgi:aspartate/methionine/tyrosine aminotransferase